MIELPTDQARRTPEKDAEIFGMLAAMDAKIEMAMATVRLPYANDLAMKLHKLRQVIEDVMDTANVSEE